MAAATAVPTAGDDDDEEEEEDDDDDLPDIPSYLFADPDPYDTFQFEYEQNIHIMLRGYKAENGQTIASTGLTLWQAAPLLCDYMIAHRYVLKDKRVVELGAGLGLCGILAYRLGAKQVILTDGDTETLKLLRDNVRKNVPSSSNDAVTCEQLRWGTEMSGSRIDQQFDVVLASDVIYVEEMIDSLFDAVMELQAESGLFLLSYARRNVSIDMVLMCAERRGFKWNQPNAEEGVYVFERV